MKVDFIIGFALTKPSLVRHILPLKPRHGFTTVTKQILDTAEWLSAAQLPFARTLSRWSGTNIPAVFHNCSLISRKLRSLLSLLAQKPNAVKSHTQMSSCHLNEALPLHTSLIWQFIKINLLSKMTMAMGSFLTTLGFAPTKLTKDQAVWKST